MVSLLYGLYTFLAFGLGLANLGVGVWAWRFYHERPTSHYWGLWLIVTGLISCAYGMGMLWPPSQAFFWLKVGFSWACFSPPLFLLGVVQYRGNWAEERSFILVMLVVSAVLVLTTWIAPDFFFGNLHWAKVHGFTVAKISLNLGLLLHSTFTIAMIGVVGGFVMRFLDLDYKLTVPQLLGIGFLAMALQAFSLPLEANLAGYPIPPLLALNYPTSALLMSWILIVKRPDVRLTYAIALHPAAWHDLRNFAKALSDHTQTLGESSNLTPEMQNSVHQLQHATDSLQHYMEAISRPKAIHSSYLQKEDVLIHSLLQTVCDFWQISAQKKGIRWQTHIPTEALIATLDPTGFKRSLDNLLQNAIKFTPSGGQISITCQASDAQYILTIQDTGIGITKADQPHIFGEYQRGGNASLVEGTGLGLATVATFVKQHGGSIQVESQSEQGTTFTLTLPID